MVGGGGTTGEEERGTGERGRERGMITEWGAKVIKHLRIVD